MKKRIARNFAVMAEMHEGGIHVLRYFQTQGQAESHRVVLAMWKRVRIEAVKPKEILPVEAPFPWKSEYPGSGEFTYIRAANGRRLATLLGPQELRKMVVEIIEHLTKIA